MIQDFRGLAVFAAVAEAGSFTEAGRRLKLSTSVISHHVSKLEQKLGASLFFRSTRSLTLTPEGQSILIAAQRMVRAGAEAMDTFAQTSEQPVGSLRISVPAFGEQSPIHRTVWEFVEQHPMVSLTLHASDSPVDLVKKGFDLAIRLGRLGDSAMMNRKIGEFHRMTVASPGYLAKRPTIKTLDDLKACEFVSIAMLPDEITLEMNDEQATFLPEQTRLETTSVTAAKGAVTAGIGVQVLPTSEIEAELNSGKLVEVLPEWKPPVLGMYAVWPDLGTQKKLSRRFIEFMVSRQRPD
ncbi:MAG: LysR family transcriptional regulator [Pseudomonadota bacterium]